jgi:cell division protein FtsI (penicillin-binding protein 3)/stage V sporulation protein D (sporulation-specific penicillin-binding protein)
VAADGRIRLLRILAVAAFLLVGGRAIALASSAGELTSIAAGQQQSTHTLPAHRGAIYDRDGEELAVGEQRQTVYATPYLIEDPFAVAGDLCRVLKIRRDADQQRIVAALSDKDSGFAFIARKVDPEKAERAVALGIPGVGSYPEEKRVYPLKGVAAQVIGYAGLDNVGLAGVEQQYESILRGADGSETVVRDIEGRTIRVLETEKSTPGTSVRLTIDADIQYEAEQVLRRTVTGFAAKAGTAIVLDPRTGDLLAMANYPLVEDNVFGVDPQYERNRAVTDAYEPGSIFKAVTIAGALSDGLTTPSTKYRLAPTIKVADREIHEAHARGSVTYTTREILVHSSNVGAVTVGMDMGKEGLLKWVDKFGFGETTGIDFPGEIGGIVPREWSGSTIGNLPLGQGIAVTPMQMACAFGVLANKGMWVQPHLTAQVGTEDAPKAKRHRVVTAKVAHQMLSMLTDAVDEGTGTSARIAGYKVAGKTGTAQKPLPDGSGYSKYAYVASFVGVMPADHPKLVVLVSVDEPHPIWGGVVAAPAVKEIASFALTHLEIAP